MITIKVNLIAEATVYRNCGCTTRDISVRNVYVVQLNDIQNITKWFSLDLVIGLFIKV